jgi:hypothetical protein
VLCPDPGPGSGPPIQGSRKVVRSSSPPHHQARRAGDSFSDDGPGPRHHAIRPAGYDFHSDAVIPIAMEQWRADYRAMAAHRQMLAASIIWLYRGGKDSCWLRRVPCTWRAADGLHALRSGGYRRLGPAVSPLPRLVATPRSSPLTEAAAPCTMTAQLRSWSSAVKSVILRA